MTIVRVYDPHITPLERQLSGIAAMMHQIDSCQGPLPNEHRRSFRNRFCGGPGHADYADWRAIVDAGYALRWPWQFDYGDLFKLTRAGAEVALRVRERLEPEDFSS